LFRIIGRKAVEVARTGAPFEKRSTGEKRRVSSAVHWEKKWRPNKSGKRDLSDHMVRPQYKRTDRKLN